jgi:hypothetical protein
VAQVLQFAFVLLRWKLPGVIYRRFFDRHNSSS